MATSRSRIDRAMTEKFGDRGRPHDRERFTLQLSLIDNHNFGSSIHMAIDCDDALRISPRAVDEMRLSADLGVSLVSDSQVVTLIMTKELRRDLFKREALRLAGKLADRMEDAEGWHDPDRIEPARKELGGESRMDRRALWLARARAYQRHEGAGRAKEFMARARAMAIGLPDGCYAVGRDDRSRS